eukprot:jgi/Chlat1/7423/Chrsp6S07440
MVESFVADAASDFLSNVSFSSFDTDGLAASTSSSYLYNSSSDGGGMQPEVAGALVAQREFLAVFLTAVSAIGKVLLVALGGAWMARKGIINNQTSSSLSKMSFSLLLPCLLFSRLAAQKELDEKLLTLWTLPAGAIAYAVVGVVLGAILVRVLHVPPIFRGGVLTSVAFGNSQGLPIVLLVAICEAHFSPADEDRAIAYVAVYSIASSFLFWGLGPHLLTTGLDDYTTPDGGIAPEAARDPKLMRVLSAHVQRKLSRSASRRGSRASSVDGGNTPDQSVSAASLDDFAQSALQQPLLANDELSSPHPKTRHSSAAPAASLPPIPSLTDIANGLPPSQFAGRPTMRTRLSKFVVKSINAVLQPPIVALILGSLVGMVDVLYDAVVERNAPGHVVWSAANTIGQAAVPVNMLLLGVRLHKGLDREETAAVGYSLIGAVCFSRLLIMPAVGLALNALRIRFGFNDPADRILCLTFLVESAVPTANNNLILARALEVDDKAIAVFLFFQYAIAPIFLTLSVAVFLYAC